MAAFLNASVRAILFSIAQNWASYSLSTTSIYLGVAIGILLPLVSNIIPIQRALGKNLRASLDANHRGSASEMAIEIKKMEEFGLSIEQLFLAIGLVTLGILNYYVAPTAFLFQRFEVFFGILNLLLIVMILGLI